MEIVKKSDIKMEIITLNVNKLIKIEEKSISNKRRGGLKKFGKLCK
jgi:hypothetical protein